MPQGSNFAKLEFSFLNDSQSERLLSIGENKTPAFLNLKMLIEKGQQISLNEGLSKCY